MTDQQQRTQWALDLLQSFIREWTPQAVRREMFDRFTGPAQQIRSAIAAIAPTEDDKAHVGWAVFKQEHDREYRREWPSGFTHTQVGVVFETDYQVANVLAGCKTKDPKGEYFICEIRRIP